jgi:phytoene/squalene synthetase
LEAIIDARSGDLDGAPLADAAAVDTYVDRTAGAVMRLSFAACGVSLAGNEQFIHAASSAWGLVSLVRAGRAPASDVQSLLERAVEAHRRARGMGHVLPAAAFPAFGYVALVPRYVSALRQGRRALALFSRQLALVMAAARGRV